jgi:hypothetical protein
MLSYMTSRALATHHLNKLNEQGQKAITGPLEAMISAKNQITPENAQEFLDHSKALLDIIKKYSSNDVYPKEIEIARKKVKSMRDQVSDKFGLKKSDDLKKRVNYIGSKMGRNKNDSIPGGVGDSTHLADFDKKEVAMGKIVEQEHSKSPRVVADIERDHLKEDKKYYTKLKGSGLAPELNRKNSKVDLNKFYKIKTNLTKSYKK